MYVETSALVAILKEEPERDDFLEKVVTAQHPVISVVSKLEAALSVGSWLQDYALAGQRVDEAVSRLNVEVIGVPADAYDDAVKCYVRYGRGTKTGGKLNFGDCLSYVMAKKAAAGVILFKGGDFSKTDLIPA